MNQYFRPKSPPEFLLATIIVVSENLPAWSALTQWDDGNDFKTRANGGVKNHDTLSLHVLTVFVEIRMMTGEQTHNSLTNLSFVELFVWAIIRRTDLKRFVSWIYITFTGVFVLHGASDTDGAFYGLCKLMIDWRLRWWRGDNRKGQCDNLNDELREDCVAYPWEPLPMSAVYRPHASHKTAPIVSNMAPLDSRHLSH